MNETPNLNLPYLLAAQAQKHVTHNEAIRALDCVVQLSVLDRNLATPPATPAEGDRYIVDSSPTGAWAGESGSIAAFQDGAWLFYPPQEGWLAWVADENALVAFDGAAWTGFSGGGGGGVTDHGALTGLADDDHPQYLNNARGDARYTPLDPATLGVNATADTTNRLAVASAATLFNHQGAGHQVKVNKSAPTDTASFLFQTGFSGRAEIGITGNDDFHFKVSANGTTWNEAIIIDRTTGAVSFPNTTLGGGGGVTDHGALTGLADDDHPQYLNNARGDARYTPLDPATLGVNATADTTNRLALSSTASLFAHAGAGHKLRVNKNAATDTANLMFETGASGRAEIGTTGDDDLHVKVSADGATWHEAIVIDRTTGACAFPNTALGGGSGGGAPTTADYLVKTANAGLSSERVVTDTESVVADWATSGAVQFKVPGYAALMSSMAYTSMMLADVLNYAQFPGANSIADAFDDLTYVNTAGATNLSTATEGVLKPTGTDAFSTVNDPNPTTNAGSSTNYNIRHVVTAANLGANDGDKIRLTFKAASTGSITINALYVGHKGASAPNFDGNQVQVTFNGGSATATAAANTSITSDAINFAFDHTKDLVIAFDISGDLPYASPAGWTRYYKLASGESDNTTVSGYTSDNAITGIDLVEIRTGTSGYNSLTVASAALPFTDQPATMSGHLLVKEVSAATANTDFFLDFSRDGGTNWSQATLALVRALPVAGGVTLKQYASNPVDVSAQTYSAPKYRFRTANDKLVELHAIYTEGS